MYGVQRTGEFSIRKDWNVGLKNNSHPEEWASVDLVTTVKEGDGLYHPSIMILKVERFKVKFE